MSVSRLDACFQRLREQQRKALIPFITAGDPSLEATVPVMHALVEAGADVIELGVPFSDPMADGPTIQRSSERALARGAGSRYVLQAVAQFRERDAQTPVVLMGYLNPVEIHGYAAFAKAAVDAGVDGVLLVDLPPEEAGEAQQAFDAAGLALVLLASPTTSQARADKLLALARGYLYYVSFAGVTGASERLDSDAASTRLQALRARASVPVVAGFGIKDAASAAAMARQADGVVVGSALVASSFDFAFMGGSMGSVVGERFALAAETAVEIGAPYVCFSQSGGARMQEGLFSLMQMAKTSAALGKLREAGLPYISVLTHPTTGGVSASFAMLGDINIAEPQALIGFAGPRVIEQTVREKLPEGFQRSEFLLEHGAIDQICDRRELRDRLSDLLAMLGRQPAPEVA